MKAAVLNGGSPAAIVVVIGATVQGTVLKGENLADTVATARDAVLNGGSPAAIVVVIGV